MRLVYQRVKNARVDIEGETVASIGAGALLLLGVCPEDTEAEGALLARKAAELRVFCDQMDWKDSLSSPQKKACRPIRAGGISPRNRLSLKRYAVLSGFPPRKEQRSKMNLSLLDVGGSALLVSNFTLYADCRHGRRPAFTGAARPEQAQPLVERFAAQLREAGVKDVQTGVFGADMQVSLLNDGPVTIWLDTDELKRK